jgi:extracellular elastinolytic metalloproteinase
MEHNWYEAAVSATGPHRINDPSEEKRSLEKEHYEVLASPRGWHSLPYPNDPSTPGIRKAPGSVWTNTTTTWGNNVTTSPTSHCFGSSLRSSYQVFAQENWAGQNDYIDNKRPDPGESLVFDYQYDPKLTKTKPDSLAEAKKYINFTVTQLFYTNNLIHDLYYPVGHYSLNELREILFVTGSTRFRVTSSNTTLVAEARKTTVSSHMLRTVPDLTVRIS